jgi:Zn-dependent alcohol dehydrogenase
MFGRPAIPAATMADGTPVLMANGPSGYAEYLVTWEEFLVPVFTRVPVVELSLLACVSACGLGLAMCRFPIEAGSDVVVFGLGPVGLSAVQGARIQGATRIIGNAPSPPRAGETAARRTCPATSPACRRSATSRDS